MRVLAPAIGPVPVAVLRILIAGIALVIYFRVIGFDPEWKLNWKHYLVIGVVNSAVPFLFYAYAALHIPAMLSSIVNSTSPLWAAIFSAIWLAERLTTRKVAGIVLGTSGVAIITLKDSIHFGDAAFLAVIACVGATICYGLAAIYVKKIATTCKAAGIAGGSQLLAGLLFTPLLFIVPFHGTVTGSVVVNMLALALICSAVAYLLYYRLIQDVGPTKGLTVTFLIPVFGILWGTVFLHEQLTIRVLAGCALIIAGTWLVTRGKTAR